MTNSDRTEVWDDENDFHKQWVESVEYQEAVDAMLDDYDVPIHREGKTLWLKERVQLLAETGRERNALAFELFSAIDKQYGEQLRNGDWFSFGNVWKKAKNVFGVV